MKYKVACIIIALSILGCGTENNITKSNDSIVYISEFPSTYTLNDAEELPIDILDPADIFVSDSYLIFFQRHEAKMFQVYDKSTNKFVGATLSEGRGPNEVEMMNLITQWDVADGSAKIRVQSYPHFIAWLDVNASIEQGKTVLLDKVDFTTSPDKSLLMMESNSLNYIDNGKLWILKSPERSGTQNISYSPFYVVYDIENNTVSDTLYKYDIPSKLKLSSLLFSSFSSMSPDKKRAGAAHSHMNLIIIYDLVNFSKKSICFAPDALDYEKAEKNLQPYYRDTHATDKYFWALTRFDENKPSAVDVLNWNGDPICKLNLDVNARLMFVDDVQKKLYVVTDTDKILRYDVSMID